MHMDKRIIPKAINVILIIIGISLLTISTIYVSSFTAILGVAFLFLAGIFLYITPVKHVPLILLNASLNSNIDRILNEFDLSEKGIYLPPKNIGNSAISLVFIPGSPNSILPPPEEISEGLFLKFKKTGIIINPPGLALSQLFEQQTGESFTKYKLEDLKNKLPRIIVEDLELAEKLELIIEKDTVLIQITGSLFNDICRNTDNQPRTHSQVGCLLSSAIACVLAKTTGKCITLQKETYISRTKILFLEYHVGEE
jgi:hypothetical protein